MSNPPWPMSSMRGFGNFQPPEPPPGFHAARNLIVVGTILIFAVAVLGTGYNACLESGMGTGTMQGRGEADARRYALQQHPDATEVQATCVVMGGGDMPCTVMGRAPAGAFSESVRCRASLMVGPRGCYRHIDRSITIEREP